MRIHFLLYLLSLMFISETIFAQSKEKENFSDLEAASDADLLGKMSMLSGLTAVEFSERERKKCFQEKPKLSSCKNLTNGLSQMETMFDRGEQAFKARDGISGYIYDWSDLTTQLKAVNIAKGHYINKAFTKALKEGRLESYSLTASLGGKYFDTVISDLKNINAMTYDKETQILTGPTGELKGSSQLNIASLNSKYEKVKTLVLKRQKHLVSQNIKNIKNSMSRRNKLRYEESFSHRGKKDVFAINYVLAKRGLASTSIGPAISKYKFKQKVYLTALSNTPRADFGVSGDNLFNMVSRRFKKKVKSREFIFNEK